MRILIIVILLLFIGGITPAQEFVYILNDSCIVELYDIAEETFKNTDIIPIRDTHGLLIRFELKDPQKNYNTITEDTYDKISKIEYFLAKIENPVIIEVHTENLSAGEVKNWEISTVIANKIEEIMQQKISKNRIHSVGYGEFLPAKNTPYNGGKYLNRVDIMILCNISGE